MPHDVERAPSEADSLLDRGHREIKRFWEGFIDFAFQGNILQIAFGLILAATFTDMVKSFVGDILMPPISIILPLNRNIEEKFAVLKPGPNYNASTGYTTLHIAQDDGAVVLAYGMFIYQLVSFVMVGFALYGLAHLYQMISHDPIIKHTKKCKYCRQSINAKVSCNALTALEAVQILDADIEHRGHGVSRRSVALTARAGLMEGKTILAGPRTTSL